MSSMPTVKPQTESERAASDEAERRWARDFSGEKPVRKTVRILAAEVLRSRA